MYFDKELVIKATKELQVNTPSKFNQFFGLLSIFRLINTSTVQPLVQYNLSDKEISNWLDLTLTVIETKPSKRKSTKTVLFSTQWDKYIKENVSNSTSLQALLIFLYKYTEFKQKPTFDELREQFKKEFHLTDENLDSFFNQEEKIELSFNFSEQPISKKELKTKLKITQKSIVFEPNSKGNKNTAGQTSSAPFFQTLYAAIESINCLIISNNKIDEYYPTNQIKLTDKAGKIRPEQIIYFGAPGSGKSSTIKRDYEKDNESRVHRTTFHPDSDYSSFVGCYKPQTDIKTDDDGNIIEKKITYEFTPQVFTDAYVEAWNDCENMHYLIIEEINRGNCAQVFGDLFQLLDRKKDTGLSEYRIKADKDLRDYLESKLPEGNYGIADGKLCLPPNLSIIASMNTSDQSLFPMDSAFKRRWAWRYVPIDYENELSSTFLIRNDTNSYSWNKFLYMINREVKRVTSSEDKQMGNFFIKDNISEKDFIDKVMFYLWSEVGKDNYQTKDAIFVYDNEKNEQVEFSFNELFTSDKTKILDKFIQKLEKKYGKDYEDSYKSVGNASATDRVYTFDGNVYTQKEYSDLGVAIIKKFIQKHTGLKYQELSDLLDRPRLLAKTRNGTHVLMTPEMMDENSSYKTTYLEETDTYDGQQYHIFKCWGPTFIQDVVDFAIKEELMEESEGEVNNGAENETDHGAEDGLSNDAVE